MLEQSTTTLFLNQGYWSLDDAVYDVDPGDNWDFSFVGTGVYSDYVKVTSASILVDLVLGLYDQYGQYYEVDNDKNPADGNAEVVSLKDIPAGTYRATVFDKYNGYYLGLNNTFAPYALEINATHIPADSWEGFLGNNTIITATAVNSGGAIPSI